MKNIDYNRNYKHKYLKNLHGDGNAADKIIRVIKKIHDFKKLLNKKTTY